MNELEIKVFNVLEQNIKTAREEKGMTIIDIAKKTGIRVVYLKKIEEGSARKWNVDHLFRIAKALEIPPHCLAEGV